VRGGFETHIKPIVKIESLNCHLSAHIAGAIPDVE
jgi:hypothetical protein